MKEVTNHERNRIVQCLKVQLRRVMRPDVLLAILLIVGLYQLFGCPIRYTTGIACPGCGMTRAMAALLTFRFGEALYFHPLVILLPFLCLVWIFRQKLPAENVWRIYLPIGVGILFFSVYIYRMFLGDNTVVNVISPPIRDDFHKLLQLRRKF